MTSPPVESKATLSDRELPSSQCKNNLAPIKIIARLGSKRKADTAISSDYSANDSPLTSLISAHEDNRKKPYWDIPPHLLKLADNTYPATHNGPFEVRIEGYVLGKTNHTTKDVPHISELQLGKAALKQIGLVWNEATDLKNVGASKFTVKFASRDTANLIIKKFLSVRDQLFSHSSWVAYIPNYKLQRICITWDLESSDSAEDIIKYLSPPPGWSGSWLKILSAKNISASAPDKQGPLGRKKSRPTFLITFESTTYPERASLYGKIIKLKPYVQKVIRCSHCQRFGHIAEQCRSRSSPAICAKCGDPGHAEPSCPSSSPKCINCVRQRRDDFNHAASSLHCAVFIESRNIKQLMSILGTSNMDARDFYRRYAADIPPSWFNDSSLLSHSSPPPERFDSYLARYVPSLSPTYSSVLSNNSFSPRSSISDDNLHFPPLMPDRRHIRWPEGATTAGERLRANDGFTSADHPPNLPLESISSNVHSIKSRKSI